MTILSMTSLVFPSIITIEIEPPSLCCIVAYILPFSILSARTYDPSTQTHTNCGEVTQPRTSTPDIGRILPDRGMIYLYLNKSQTNQYLSLAMELKQML